LPAGSVKYEPVQRPADDLGQRRGGSGAADRVRLIVWCLDCKHQVEPDPAGMAERYGAEMSVPDWHKRLVCSQCRSRRVDMVVSGTER
jgi:hypothetical protein